MIPLVFLDLDGTIVGRSGQVNQAVWEAAKNAAEAGVKIAVNTGRPGFGVALKIAERLGVSNPHVFQNGAHVGYADGRTVQVSALKEADVLAIVEESRGAGVTLELYTVDGLYVERSSTLSQRHADMIGVTPLVRDLEDVVAQDPIVRAQLVTPLGTEAEMIAGLPADVEVSTAVSPALAGVAFVSLTRKGATKASGARCLADHLRIGLDRAMAVGDTVGDLPMLEVVGHPRVMGNASPELRERFTVLGDVEDDGAVTALQEAMSSVTD